MNQKSIIESQFLILDSCEDQVSSVNLLLNGTVYFVESDQYVDAFVFYHKNISITSNIMLELKFQTNLINQGLFPFLVEIHV